MTGISAVGIVNTSYGYERDTAGRITRWTGDGSDWFYRYDAAGRLVRADHGQDNFSYTYDPVGNILDNGRTHDIANRLLADNDYTFTYDLNGNLTRKQHKTTGERTEYSWNALNKLVKIDRYQGVVATTPAKTLMYAYDSFGRRVSKTEDVVNERYVYDGNDLIGVLDGSGNIKVTSTFSFGIDQPIGSYFSTENQFYYVNHQGSIMETSNSSHMLNQYGYDSFGGTTVKDGAPGLFAYTAREQDADDIYYYRARYYDPSIRRFISEDPIGLFGGINLYSYVRNDPVNFIDPTGEFVFGKRPLQNLPWIPGASSNPIDDYFNTEISHEHGFFEDEIGGNIGFSPGGRFSEDPTGKGYRYDTKHYDDAIMREALNNVVDGEYSLLGLDGKKKNNCQDWADRLREEYEKIAKQKKDCPPE